MERLEKLSLDSKTKPFFHSTLRLVLLLVIAGNIGMAVIAMFMYPPLLTMPHSYSYILELGIMFLVYVPIVFWATKPSVAASTLQIATFWGVIAGLLEMVHISVENFGHLTARAETVSTGIFMGLLFLLFAVSGCRITLRNRNLISGVLCGSWSAVVCMLLVMTYGLSQLFWSFGAIEKHDMGDPDFIRTGWTDMHAFVIADIFEACFKILLVGPMAGIIFGFLGAALARLIFLRKVQ